MSSSLRLMMLALGLALTPVAEAKRDRAKEENARREKRERELLADSVRHYYDALRWADPATASGFIEDARFQVLYQDWFTQEQARYKITGHKVLLIEVGAEIEKPTNHRLRLAQVHITVEGYAMPSQVVDNRRLAEPWVRTPDGWKIAWDPVAAGAIPAAVPLPPAPPAEGTAPAAAEGAPKVPGPAKPGSPAPAGD